MVYVSSLSAALSGAINIARGAEARSLTATVGNFPGATSLAVIFTCYFDVYI